jgi:hypothetical protein
MSEASEEMDLIDRIAEALPAEVRTAYYRELNYCRSLPDNDEVLRILRAMQFLTLLMREVPERVADERQRLELLFREAVAGLAITSERTAAYQRGLEMRLCELPAEVAKGLSPERVAGEINENLRQQFVQSTIPQTAQAMAAISGQLRESVAEFARSTTALSVSYKGAVVDARQAIAGIEHCVSAAAATSRRAAEELSSVFQREFRWSLYVLVSVGMVVGLGAGMLFEHWIEMPQEAPAMSRPSTETKPAKVRQEAR